MLIISTIDFMCECSFNLFSYFVLVLKTRENCESSLASISISESIITQNDTTINYDARHIISIIGKVNKNKPFEHLEIVGMDESVNWIDYPHGTQRDEDTQQGSTSSMKDSSSTQLGPSSIVPIAENITPIASCSERTNKRDFFDVMEYTE